MSLRTPDSARTPRAAKSGVFRIVLGVFLATLAWSEHARAYCRTAACIPAGVSVMCSPIDPTRESPDCVLPLSWNERCIGYSIQRDGARSVSPELAADLVERAFDTWTQADCGGAHPTIALQRQPDATCAAPDYNLHGGNANVVMFRDDGWPYPYAEDVLGLATVTFDVDTGEIYDVDIEINTTDFAFTTGDTTVGFDLGSTLQHETGHFFGISHSAFEDATMFATPHEGSTQGRRLSADDAEAICAVYPPESAISAHDCKPAPHPFSAECSGEVSDTSRDAGTDVGCTLASTAKRSMPSGGLALAAFCLLSAFGRVRRNAARGSTQSASSRPYSFRTRSSFNRRRPPA